MDAVHFDNIPEELKRYEQWLLWRSNGKSKIPTQPDGTPASSTDAKTWTDFESAVEAYESGGFDGVGFVFTGDDPFVGIDLDDCIINGELTDEARQWCDRFNSYTEVTPSGSGIHIIVKGSAPTAKGLNDGGGHEAYCVGRYFTVTGNRLQEYPR